MSYSVILPTLNEEGHIVNLIEEIAKNFINKEEIYEIIVVDDDSTDGTINKITNFIKTSSINIKLHVRKEKKNLAASINFGINLSKYENIIWMDADFQHSPEYIKNFFDHINDYEVIIFSRFLKESKRYFDSIVVGAGENSFLNIIKDSKNNCLKEKYAEDYKLMPFKDTPFPDRSLMPKEFVVNDKLFSQFGEYPATLVYFSRGCIFKCSYCTYNVPRLLQTKSPKLIDEEIKYLKENYNIKGLLLKDEVAISPNLKVSKEILNTIEKNDIVWRGQTITIATLDQLKMARDSGCLELAVGVETVDNEVMKIIDKTWQNDKIIREFIDNAKKVGIKVKICLIQGLPGEPKDIVEKTIKFLKETEPDFASVSGFLPVPGSPIERNYKKYGIKYIDKDWNKYGHLLYRFSDEEDVGLPFEYEKETPFGKSFTQQEIKENMTTIQQWLDNRGMVY